MPIVWGIVFTIKRQWKSLLESYNSQGRYLEIEEFLINPTGRFEIGGFIGDAGLTGRKIVVDSYQSFAPVGGGAFSGKDPTKVDRSGAYKARQSAKEILKHNEEYNWCEVQISYSIGIEEPVAIYIKTDKGDLETPSYLYKECKPRNIIKDLNLRNISYEDKAAFGHFRDWHINFTIKLTFDKM